MPRIPTMSRVAIACLALPPALIAVLQLGRLHPDEVYQALEPAHYIAFGKGWLSWEWEHGLRNWALPGALAGLLKLAAWAGIDDPQARRAVLELPQYALHALSLAAVFRMIRRRIEPAAGELLCLAGVALIALYAPVLHYAGRTLSESFSASFLLWGLERADDKRARPRGYVLAGVLLGLAVIVRYGSAVFALSAVLYLVATRRVRDAAWVALGGALAATLLGALDAFSWGTPFHSLIEYVEYNVLSGKAAKVYGREPATFYFAWLLKALPLWWWAGAGIAARQAWKKREHGGILFVSALLYFVAIASTAHKEERFLYPALVVLLAAAVPSLVELAMQLGKLARPSFLALSLASGLVLLALPGSRFSPRATEQFRLFVLGVRTGNGVVITKSGKWGAPGYFYAATKPWRLCDKPDDACTQQAIKRNKLNRVVAYKDEGRTLLEKRGFTLRAEQGSFKLWGRD
jgi:phosphatidylinositol glycan class B